MDLENFRLVRNKLNQLKRKGLSRKEARSVATKWAKDTYGVNPAILAVILQLIQLLIPLIFPEKD